MVKVWQSMKCRKESMAFAKMCGCVQYMVMNEKDSTKPSMEEILAIKDQKKRNEAYNQYVENMTPKSNCFANCAKAFLVGGLICTLGEGLNSFYEYLGNEKELAALYGTITLIAISIILTGLNIYQKLAQFGGAGSIVPITGFANSVVSPAIEFQTEGEVFGVGCKIFTIAGPVILYGIVSSWFVGLKNQLYIYRSERNVSI